METEMKVSQSETVTKTTTIGIDEKCVVNGNGSPPMGAAFRHHLPQIASLMRNPKIAQSKTSKTEKDEATLHVEGTGKVVRLDADLKHEITIEEIPKPEPKENADGDAKQEKTENSKKTPAPRTRPPKKARREELPTNGTGDAPVEEEKMDTTNSNEEVDKLNITTVVKNPESKENKEKIVEEVKMESTNKIETPQKEESNEIDIQQKTPRRRSKESYKNIFQEPIIEGKRQRKPKVLDSEEPDSPKTSPKTAAKIEEEEKLKAKMEHIAALEERKPIDWLLGDLLWGKVSSHPWWPCMVSYDPYDGIYTKIKGKSRMYHVQYFGDEAERGWLATSTILEFQGKQKYDEHVKKCYDIAKHKKEKSKVDKLFKIYPNRMAAWKIAIKAAEEALPLSRNERRQKYTFVYEIKKPKKAAEVPTSSPSEKVEESESTETSSNSTKKRARHSVDGKAQKNSGDVCNGLIEEKKRKRATDSKESDNQTPKSKRQKTATPSESDSISHQRTVSSEGSFEVFCQKHRDSVLDDHPDFDEGMLQECLKQQWCMMSVKQKCRYKSKFATDSNTDSGKAKRVSKPSKKKLEAEEDNKLLEDLDKPGNQHKSVDSKDTQRDTEVPMATEDNSGVEVKSVSARRSSVQKSEVVQEKPAGKISKQRKSTTTDTDSNSDSQKSEVVQEKPAGKISKQRKSTTTDTDSNSDSQKSEVVQEKLAAKISKQRKSTTAETDSNSDSQDFVKSEKRVVQKCSIDDYEPEIFRLSAAGPNKKENLCQICEEVGELIECHGPCQGYFHKNCLGLKKDPSDDFKCDECQTGNHTCFVCKKADSCTKRCSVATCGKFYHEECISKIPNTRMETRGIICPLHICATCAAENAKNPKAKQGKLMRCVRCPVAYHTGDFCLAAGCVSLAGYNIVCTKHFQPIRTQKYHTHINVSWCFVCNRGGSLLCCESCPAAYHAECLKIDFPEESWYCADCSNGRKPLYGDIIWVKIGSYRWWPGEIYHPKNVPQNIQDKPHQVGEFPVRFFGSHDYFWLHQGRVFLFQEGDKGSKDSAASKGLAKIFSRGIKEATEVYKLWKAAKENKEQIENEKNDKKPAPFKFVKTNVPVGSVQIYKADLTEVPKCECKADQPNPCSSETDCINRMLMYECHPTVCPAGEKCQNQRFQKREYPDSVPNKTDKRGWGLITKVDIKKGQFVNEYVGELIDEEEVKRRIKQAHDDNICNFYMLTLDKNRIIDAGPKGNLSRFMNHSCNPNCETQKWTVNGDVRVGLFALHDIPKGSELTFNYNLECLGNDKKACSCGATNCSGYLGVRPRSAAAVAKEERGKDKPKKKRKRKIKLDVKKEHEDECFRCGEGGELVMCDKAGCPKVYHLQCLKLTKPPHGKWQCPWHHCDTCGNTAVKMCTECPNSFCATHIEGNTFDVDGLVYCCDHDDVLEEATTSSTSSHVSDSQSELEDKPEKPPETKKTKNKKRESAQDRKRSVNSSDKEETGVKKPRQSTGRKSSSDTDGKDGKTTKFTNVVVTPTKNSADDPLAVPPMFDDSDEDEFSDLVIDIPTIL